MKIIQQDFKVSSTFLFIIFLIGTIGFTYGLFQLYILYIEEHKNLIPESYQKDNFLDRFDSKIINMNGGLILEIENTSGREIIIENTHYNSQTIVQEQYGNNKQIISLPLKIKE